MNETASTHSTFVPITIAVIPTTVLRVDTMSFIQSPDRAKLFLWEQMAKKKIPARLVNTS